MKGVDGFGCSNYVGYCHHRYIVWSDLETNTLYFLPKYNCIEIIKFDTNILQKFRLLLNNTPVYWNNYYLFDSTRKPNIFVYRNGINFDFNKDYVNIINVAINKSIEYTNDFTSKLGVNDVV
jgi:hypothetical protein